MSKKGDSARIHEQMAREELIQRISLRDNTLVIYLGAIGTLLGLASGGKISTELLLIVPFFAFGATTIIEQHHVVIGLIGRYLAVELNNEYKKIKEFVPQWDGSSTLTEKIGKYPVLLQRSIGHFLLIITPSALSLILNIKYVCAMNALALAWWTGLIFTCISIVIIFQTWNYRNELYGH